MSSQKRRPWITVWGLLGGPSGYAPWVRSATDADLERLGENVEDYESDRNEGYWSW